MQGLLVNIDVPDLDRGIAFYTAAFGLVVSRRFAEGFVELGGGAAPIFLLEKKGGTSAAGNDVRRYDRHWSPIHLDVVVDDLDDAIRRVVGAGAIPEGEARDMPFGRLAMFADPFGHGFCLIAFNQQGYGALQEIS